MLIHSEESESRSFFAALERRLSKQAFETWFRPLRITKSRDNGVLRIAVPNPAVRDWIVSQYSVALTESLRELELADCRIEWATPQEEKAQRMDVSELDLPASAYRKEKSPLGVEPAEVSQPAEIPSSPLNDKYTFSSFVVASCNRFAHAAALAVVEAPGKTYNPLIWCKLRVTPLRRRIQNCRYPIFRSSAS